MKPDEWDDDAPPKIPDPNAVKPDGWMDDGPEFIADPDAMTPDDWYGTENLSCSTMTLFYPFSPQG